MNSTRTAAVSTIVGLLAAAPFLFGADYHRDVLMVDEDRLDPYSWTDET